MAPYDDLTEEWCDDPDPQPPWNETDEDDDRMVLDCGNPDCIMQGAHFLSECCTAEDMAALEELQEVDT